MVRARVMARTPMGSLRLAGRERDAHGLLRTVAEEARVDHVTGLVGLQREHEVADSADLDDADLEDDVARDEADLLGRTAGARAGEPQAGALERVVGHRAEPDAEAAVAHRSGLGRG